MDIKKLIFIFFIWLHGNSFSQTFSGTTGNISDDGMINDFNAVVTGLNPAILDSSFGLVTVCIDITHTYDSDLNIHLVAPDGTEINLLSGLGGGDDNFTGTCLSQSAAQSIILGNAPFTGTFKPQETLGNMNNGQNANGTWILRILDTYPFADAGIVNSWSVTFGLNPAVPIVFSSSSLPIVVINTNGAYIPDEPKINATMGIIYNGPGAMNHVTDPLNDYSGTVGIEMRGAYSQSLPQKPYNFETRDTNGNKQNVSLLSMPPEHDWCLIANYNDKVFMRNVLAYKLSGDMGHYSSRTRFCEVLLNGQYQGIYILCESIKRDVNRVPVEKCDSAANSGLAVTGGYIIKNDYWSWNNSWLSNYHPVDHPAFDVHLVYHYPKPDVITIQQKNYIQNFIYNFETALYSPAFTNPVNGYRKYMDVSSFIDYLIVNELSRNNDGFKKSSYFYKDQDDSLQISKLKAGPVWDFDWAWKDIQGCNIYSATDGSGWAYHINDCQPDVNSPGWYVRLMQDSSFRNEFRCRWDFLRNNIMSNTSLHNYIDSVALVLNDAQTRHFEKWGNLGVNTGTPEVEPDPLTFQLQINQFKDWIDRRLAWLDANVPGNTAGCGFAAIESMTEHNEKIVAYPDPSNDFIYLHSVSGNNLPDKLMIYDITGKKLPDINFVADELKTERTIKINVSGFASGIYFLKCLSKDGIPVSVKQIVVMH